MTGAAITRLGANMDTCRPVTGDVRTTARVVTWAGSAAGTMAGTVNTSIAGEGRMAADPATAKEDTAVAEATVADSPT
jgi:hypothetical protein